MKWISSFILLVIILIAITFAILNAQVVTVNYLVGKATVAVSLLVVITFVTGGVLGLLASLAMVLRYRYRLRGTEKKLQRARQALADQRIGHE